LVPLNDSGLNTQQQRFVDEYLIDPTTAKGAAIRAGYEISNAIGQASRLMAMPKIQTAIAQGQKERAARLGITQERVLQELALLAFANLKDIIIHNPDGTTTIDMNQMPRSVAAALGEVSVSEKGGKVKTRTAKAVLQGKQFALEKLGKHLGMFTEKVEHTGILTLEQLVSQSMEDTEE
jgi:phage terminase small subunit